MTPIEKLKWRIAALLRHAGGTDNPKEATSFTEKARALMEQYGIDAMDQPDEGQDRSTLPPNELGMAWYDMGNSSESYVFLMGEVSRYYGCHPVFKRGDLAKVRLYGRESARVTVPVMFEFVISECKRIGESRANRMDYDKQWAINDMIGGISVILADMARSSPARIPIAFGSGPALAEARKYQQDKYPSKFVDINVRASCSRYGYRNARGISLARQTSSTNRTQSGPQSGVHPLLS